MQRSRLSRGPLAALLCAPLLAAGMERAALGQLTLPLSQNATTNGPAFRISNLSNTDGAAGINGNAAGATGVVYGVRGSTGSTNGRGLFGDSRGTTGLNYGVYGQSLSPAGIGVLGLSEVGGIGVRAQSATGRALDVIGTSNFSSTATFVGAATFNSDMNFAVNRQINCNGNLTFAGTALNLSLGDTSGDTVQVPGLLELDGARLRMGDADEDQIIGFFDGGVADASSIMWDDTMSPLTCGTLGTITSAFIWNLGDNGNTGWLFGNGSDYEFKIGSIGDVEMDGVFTQNGTCDLAEAFLGPDNLSAGTVVSLDPDAPEAVRMTTGAYDSGLVGVVSTRPGILMRGPTADAYPLIVEMTELARMREALPLPDTQVDDRINELEASIDSWTRGNVDVALVGRVPVKVDASFGAIRAGDALTSSPSAGYAMKATRAGMIIGKALTGLETGRGEVIVLLQVGHWAPPAAAGAAMRGDAPNGAEIIADALVAAGAEALRAELTTQQQSVAALRAENAALQARLSRLEAALERMAPAGDSGE